jgi:hypothetical protein
MEEEENKKFEKISDRRVLRPLVIAAEKQKKMISLIHNEIYIIDETKINFATPNNISVCLNISNKHYDLAKEVFKKELKPKLTGKKKIINFNGSENSLLYDYFENLQISLIFVYTAVEAFANVAIPDSFTYEKRNNKNVKEIWEKESIERWLSTTEKIAEIVPSVLKLQSPKSEKFWTNFKKLEEIRNEIIHQKTVSNETNVSSKYLTEFFKESIFNIISSGFLVIEYFCSKTEYAHIYFPLGIGTNKMKPTIIDDWDTHFKTIDDEDE